MTEDHARIPAWMRRLCVTTRTYKMMTRVARARHFALTKALSALFPSVCAHARLGVLGCGEQEDQDTLSLLHGVSREASDRRMDTSWVQGKARKGGVRGRGRS